tara:strand:+ start:715 stop:969 length:255 start_codon:yes stop_codon:yes gene_type:complete
MTEIPKGHGKWHGGKGSAPKQSDHQKYTENYDKIFGRKDKGLSEDEFPDRARPDGLTWQKHIKDIKAPPMPNGLQRAWERKEKK